MDPSLLIVMTLIVNEIDVLSSAQKTILGQQLDSVDSSSYDGLVGKFTIAKWSIVIIRY